ncbi:MAG: bifunctional (p)ppGpp synthetase/guanosine-3',5'-bis(diphosphate) 3'-pyrophosphohydrolase, partial [Nannocystis sp.]
PVPGDAVIGYITRGRGVAIHRRDCPNIVSSSEPERLIEIEWGQNRSRYPTTVAIQANDRVGLLRDITEVFADLGVSMTQINVVTNRKDKTAMLTTSLEVSSNEQLVRILGRIERIPGVFKARRQR